MSIEADTFNKVIAYNGMSYACTFQGKTVDSERVYFVDIYQNGQSAGNSEMKYNPETGNFYTSDSTTAIAADLEQLLSDAIQNHHL